VTRALACSWPTSPEQEKADTSAAVGGGVSGRAAEELQTCQEPVGAQTCQGHDHTDAGQRARTELAVGRDRTVQDQVANDRGPPCPDGILERTKHLLLPRIMGTDRCLHQPHACLPDCLHGECWNGDACADRGTQLRGSSHGKVRSCILCKSAGSVSGSCSGGGEKEKLAGELPTRQVPTKAAHWH